VATPSLNALASCPRVSMDGRPRGNSIEPNAVANPSEVQPKLEKNYNRVVCESLGGKKCRIYVAGIAILCFRFNSSWPLRADGVGHNYGGDG
jgi:hypothetical protein